MANFLPPQLNLLYEDDDILVVSKASGLLSVASEAEKEETALKYLNEYLRAKKKQQRVHPVHRLDRDTSGVMMFAKNFKTKEKLKLKFAAHDIERTYVAVVEGRLSPSRGTVRSYLYEDATYTVRTTEDENLGKKAITHFQVMDAGDHFTMVEVTLETGRKNQIRVHLASLGHPVAGDTKYGARTNPLGRLGLHAQLLGFDHPATGKHMVFTAPLPDVFRHVRL
jgi:RluA family pseudouridine synthase